MKEGRKEGGREGRKEGRKEGRNTEPYFTICMECRLFTVSDCDIC